MTPVAIGDIQRTQGTRKPCIMLKTVRDTCPVSTDNKKDQFLKSTFFFMKLYLKQHKRYIAENNYFFRTSGDMWFDVMNQYEGIGKVLLMTC